MLDGSRPLDEKDEELLALCKEKTHIVVYNKKDLHDVSDKICISAAQQDITALTDEIHRLFDHHKIVMKQPIVK